MKYTQKPQTIGQQIEILKSSGLTIDDEKMAAKHLSTIGYNRLRAYIDPLQFKERKKDSRFVRKNIHFLRFCQES
ncbi:hypothetical protein AGMMS4957_05630 [Bacteroidia bacterium]|nr:hypothetical protein AGMMS4957_05630 [Bacteroidia bacterium]